MPSEANTDQYQKNERNMFDVVSSANCFLCSFARASIMQRRWAVSASVKLRLPYHLAMATATDSASLGGAGGRRRRP
jgi:hypothetical protein